MATPLRASTSESIADTSAASLPPMPPQHVAAYHRMAREPSIFDGYEDGMWVAFSGESIVAAGHDHDAVVRVAVEAGEPDPLIVPLMADPHVG